MTKNNYAKGANAERAFIKQSEAEGFICVRSAGSHSSIDAVLFHPIHGTFVCQFKVGKHPSRKPDKEFGALKLPAGIRKWWITKKDRQAWNIVEVY